MTRLHHPASIPGLLGTLAQAGVPVVLDDRGNLVVGNGGVHPGDGPPAPEDGLPGDIWYDNTNGDIYWKNPATGDWEIVFEALNQADYDDLVLLIEGRVRWENKWEQVQYQTNDMVLDGNWTMIANKDTTDRAAPQPIGTAFWLLPDNPTWVVIETTNYVKQGLHLIVPAGKLTELQSYRVWIEDNSPDARYRVYYLDNNTGLIEVGEEFTGDIVPVPGWLEVPVSRGFAAGSDVFIWLRGENHQANTTFNHAWVRGPNNQNNVDPGVGNWTTDNQFTSLRINKTDDDATDRSAELASVTIGSTLRPTSEGDPDAFLEYEVLTITDMGTWFQYGVTLLATGTNGEPPIGTRDQIYFEIPIPAPTDYVTLLNGLAAYPNASGILEIGETGVVESADGHAMDVFLQEYIASPDWDLVSAIGGSGGGGGSEPTPQLQQLEAWPTGPTFISGPYSILGNVLTIPAGRGVIMDSYSDPEDTPVVTALDWIEQTIDFGSVTTRHTSFVYIDAAGIAQFDTVGPDGALLRQRQYLGRVFHRTWDGTLAADFRPYHPVPNATSHTLYDFILAVGGAFLFEGADVSPNTDLTFGVNDSKWFSPGESWQQDRDDPNVANNPGSDPLLFTYVWSTQNDVAQTTLVDPTMYEFPLGTIASVPGGSQTTTIQRLYAFINGEYGMAYGQATYPTLDDALLNLSVDIQNFVPPDYIENEGQIALVAYFLMEKGAINLEDGTDVIIVNDARLPIGGGGSTVHNHDATYLKLSGGVMAGDINMASSDLYGLVNPPPQLTSAVSLAYLNEVVALYLPLTGGTMSGTINMNANQIDNVTIILGDFNANFVLRPRSGRSLVLADELGGTRVAINPGGNIDFRRVDGSTVAFRWNEAGSRIEFFNAPSMGDKKILNVADPTNLQDAATKKYVDDGLALYLPLAGGLMSGDIDMGGNDIRNLADPTVAQDAATKAYVDTQDALYLPLSGGTMTGFITLHADPTAALHAATKNYVDINDIPQTFLHADLTDVSTSQHHVRYSDAEAIAAVGPHFSGDHADLSNVTTSQHHVRYADSEAIAAVDNGTYLKLTGGTLTGFLTLHANPVDAAHAATKLYVDNAIGGIPPEFSGDHSDLINVTTSQHHVRYSDAEAIAAVGPIPPPQTFLHDDLTDVSANQHHTRYTDAEAIAAVDNGTYLKLAGGVMTGELDMGLNKIVRLADPFNPADALPLSFADLRYAGIGTIFPGGHSDLTGVSTSQHHVRYDDPEAVSAMGLIGNTNPLNHNRYSDAEAISAVGPHTPAQTFLHADLTDVSANQHHTKYTDAEARAAVDNGTYLKLAGGSMTGNIAMSVNSSIFFDLGDTAGDWKFGLANNASDHYRIEYSGEFATPVSFSLGGDATQQIDLHINKGDIFITSGLLWMNGGNIEMGAHEIRNLKALEIPNAGTIGGRWRMAQNVDNQLDLYITGGTTSDRGQLRVYGSGTPTVDLNLFAGIVLPDAWINLNLINSWTDHSVTFYGAQYRKTKEGNVQLRGMIKGGITGSGTTIAILPVGFRPTKQVLVGIYGSIGAARMDIKTNGDITTNTGWDAGFMAIDLIFSIDA